AIKMAIGIQDKNFAKNKLPQVNLRPSSPWQSIGLFRGRPFRAKIVCLNSKHQSICSKTLESDLFGNFSFTIPSEKFSEPLFAIEIYENQFHEGLELLLGIFMPLQVPNPKKIVICD